MRAEVSRIEELLRVHPGTVAYDEVGELSRAWDTFDAAWLNLLAMMQAGETNQELAVALVDWHGVKSAAIMKASDSTLHAFEGALGSLIDITRRIVRKQPQSLQDEFAVRNTTAIAVDGAGFLRDLRNYLMHVGGAPWYVTVHFKEGQACARILMKQDALCRWSGWSPTSLTYILAREFVSLSEILPTYRNTMRDVYVWLFEAIQDAHAEETAAANELIRQRNLALSGGLYEDRAAFMSMVENAVAQYHATRNRDVPPPISSAASDT